MSKSVKGKAPEGKSRSRMVASAKKLPSAPSSANASVKANVLNEVATPTPTPTPTTKDREMNLTRIDKARKSNNVVYGIEGMRGSVRVSKSLFADKTGPTTLTSLDQLDAQPTPKKAKLTAEEKLARRAARTNLTDEQKLAAILKRAEALRAKIGQ